MTALETKIIKLKARVEKLEYIMKYLTKDVAFIL